MLLRELKSNLIYKLTEAVLIALILLLSNSILAKHLSLNDFGVYSLGMLWSLIIIILSFGFSLPALLSRELCQRQTQSAIITNVFFLQFLLGLLVLLLYAIVFFTVPYFSALKNTGFIVYIIFSLILAAPLSMQGVLSSQEKMGTICLIKVGSYLINLLALIAISKFNLSLSWAFSAQLILVFGFSAGFYFASDTGRQLAFSKLDFKEIRYLFGQSAVLVLITFFLQLYSRFNLIILDLTLGKESVATYAGASRIMESLLMIVVALNAGVFPNLMKLASQPEKFWQLYKSFTRLVVYGLFPICVIIMIYASEILEFLYGQEFTKASGTLQILMSACCLAFLNANFYNIFFAYKKQNIYLILSIGALLLNIIASCLLIPVFAEQGAAASILLTEFLFLVCSLVAVKSVRTNILCNTTG